LGHLPPGCAFAPRCAEVQARCHVEAPDSRHLDQRLLRCHHPLPNPLLATINPARPSA
jgi:ABC-type antimicrobial peptide transport system ATPase subunit